MADEDYDIDIYGDEQSNANNTSQTVQSHDNSNYDQEDSRDAQNQDNQDYGDDQVHGGDYENRDDHGEHSDGQNPEERPQMGNQYNAPPQQGVKRKESSDERPVDPGATSALLVSELNWWNTDGDVRGWARDANCEDELKDVTFSEHKVNGKSKG